MAGLWINRWPRAGQAVTMSRMSEFPEPWPLRHLVLRTPRLELRPPDEAGLYELCDRAHEGIHPADFMPFAVEWTDVDPHELGPNLLRFHWGQLAACMPGDWTINFLVRADGKVIGTQGLIGKWFAVRREVSTGSWLGRRFQGRGYGAEMRAAVLMFAFDHLGAEQARSAAFTSNGASHAVSAKLGYRRDGTERLAVRGKAVTDVRLLLVKDEFVRPGWTLQTEGVEGCLPFLAGGEEPTKEG